MNKYYKSPSLWGRIATALTEAIFPSRCMFCEDFFHPSHAYDELRRKNFYRKHFEYDRYELFQDVMIPFLCPACSRDFSLIDNCLKLKPFGVAGAVSLYSKEEELFSTLIKRFKYNEKIQLSKPLGTLLFSTFVKYWDVNEIDWIMPIPLHINRFRDRGFNQAYLLIKDWHDIAENWDMDFPSEKIDRNTLIRIRDTRPQAECDGMERSKNVRNAFKVRYPLKVKGKRVLLVDDVYTTGSTVDECTKELMKSGAKQVDVLTLARTGKRIGGEKKMGLKFEFVPIGEFRISAEAGKELMTVTASCVALILYDAEKCIAGMLHVVLPGRRKHRREDDRNAFFADTGVPLLIEEMLRHGAVRENLVAIVAGGGKLLTQGKDAVDIGKQNAETVTDLLRQEKIPIIKSDVGGKEGRRITFNVTNGQVKIEIIRGQGTESRVQELGIRNQEPAINTQQPAASSLFFKKFIELKPNPAGAGLLLEAIHQFPVNWKNVQQIISRDVVLAMHFFRIANSPYYGQPNQVSSFENALKIMGIRQLRRVCILAAITRQSRGIPNSVEISKTMISHHSLATAVICRYLASKIPNVVSSLKNQAGSSQRLEPTSPAGSSLKNQAGSSLKNQAGSSLRLEPTSPAGSSLKNQAGSSQRLEPTSPAGSSLKNPVGSSLRLEPTSRFQDDVFTAGLLHGIGCLRAMLESDSFSLESENNYGKIGGYVLSEFKLPEHIITAIALHAPLAAECKVPLCTNDEQGQSETLHSEGKRLAAFIHVGCGISRLLGITTTLEPETFRLSSRAIKAVCQRDDLFCILPGVINELKKEKLLESFDLYP